MVTIEKNARMKLLSRRRSLLKLYEENASEAQRLQQEAEPDWIDRARDVEDETVLNRLSEKERTELEQIEAALMRISKGEYGQCAQCGGAIGRQRLMAIPEAGLCIDCSYQVERAVG